MTATPFIKNIERYRKAFINAGEGGSIKRGIVIAGLNRWFFESAIIVKGKSVMIQHPTRFFDTEMNSLFPELNAALNRGLRKCGIVPEFGTYNITINPAASGNKARSIVYKFPDTKLTKDFEEFLEALKAVLIKENESRSAAAGKTICRR